jgi:periplasmic glucans biosynthesis protein
MHHSAFSRLLFSLWLAFGAAAGWAFSFDDVAAQAAATAKRPYKSGPSISPQLAALTYDQYRRIQFRQEQSLWRGAGLPFQVQFFHAGRYAAKPIKLFEVVDGRANPLVVKRESFQDDGLPLPAVAEIGGFKLLNPLNDASRWDEVISFLGASYLRALGAGQRYGVSARGIAVDTAGGNGEEFPDFTTFWLERPAAGAKEMVLYALLDGPRMAGAYRFNVRPGQATTVDVKARLFLRSQVATLGIAPMSSMFLSGENQPAVGDFRPEVHDSDGLQIAAASGEWVWRPLTNPRAPFVTSFATRSPKGFGLMQRDRAFGSYEDLEAHYERRPSVWVEPLGDWGAGRVELLQFHTPDETHDNAAAYWVPEKQPAPGQPLDISWRLHWAADNAARPPGAMAVQTRRGHGWRDDALATTDTQLHIDFDGPALTSGAGVEAVASANANVRGLRALAVPNPARGGWRVTLDFERIDPRQAVELRMFLRHNGQALSETWSYALAPEP